MANPVLVVKSDTEIPLYVSGDPNWDDQVLILNGSTDQGYAEASEGSPVTASVEWNFPPDSLMMGVYVSQGELNSQDFYSLSIGVDPDSGLMGVTDSVLFGSPTVTYAITGQTEDTVTLTFTDS